MSVYEEQLGCIKTKLALAREADYRCREHGARAHRYALGRPLTEDEVDAFEVAHGGLCLPPAFRAFLTQIGNGGAGPNYGIYPLDRCIEALHGYLKDIDSQTFFSRQPAFTSKTVHADWKTFEQALDQDRYDNDSEYEALLHRTYCGILPIGEVGCGGLNGLVLAGPDRGKVAEFVVRDFPPSFYTEATFLDWYENWLDRVVRFFGGADEAAFSITTTGDATPS